MTSSVNNGAADVRRAFDWTLIVIVGGLVAVGMPMIVSATSGGPQVWRQLAGLGAGIALAAGIVAVPYPTLRRGILPTYVFSLLLLFLVITPLGHSVKGARRWIQLGPDVQFQPSELARLALVLMLADYLAKNRGRLSDTFGVAVPGFGFVLAPMALMGPQSDLGSIILLLGLAGVLFYVAGLGWNQLGLSALFAGGVAAGLAASAQYRWERVQTFLSPFSARDDAGYQVIQGWVALASGGWFGAGYANGLAQHGLLPEAHTDFIAAVIGEEWGAGGFAILVVLQWLLVWRATHIAHRARDTFGLLAGAGITAMFGAQAVINLSVIGGLLPPKGLVLPFVSYGASAVVIHAASVGMLLKIALSAEQEVAPPAPARPRWASWRPVTAVRREPPAPSTWDDSSGGPR